MISPGFYTLKWTHKKTMHATGNIWVMIRVGATMLLRKFLLTLGSITINWWKKFERYQGVNFLMVQSQLQNQNWSYMHIHRKQLTPLSSTSFAPTKLLWKKQLLQIRVLRATPLVLHWMELLIMSHSFGNVGSLNKPLLTPSIISLLLFCT